MPAYETASTFDVFRRHGLLRDSALRLRSQIQDYEARRQRQPRIANKYARRAEEVTLQMLAPELREQATTLADIVKRHNRDAAEVGLREIRCNFPTVI